MRREYDEIKVRIYKDTHPLLKQEAERLANDRRYALGHPGINKFSLNDLIVGALQFTVTQAEKRKEGTA